MPSRDTWAGYDQENAVRGASVHYGHVGYPPYPVTTATGVVDAPKYPGRSTLSPVCIPPLSWSASRAHQPAGAPGTVPIAPIIPGFRLRITSADKTSYAAKSRFFGAYNALFAPANGPKSVRIRCTSPGIPRVARNRPPRESESFRVAVPLHLQNLSSPTPTI